jgi:hypothetical protein
MQTASSCAALHCLPVACLSLLYLYSIYSDTIYFTSLSRNSSTGRCRGFTKSFPSLTFSSFSSYYLPFNCPFLQNLLQPFFPSLSESSFGSFPLYYCLPGRFGVSLVPILTMCPKHMNCANYGKKLLKINVYWISLKLCLKYFSL